MPPHCASPKSAQVTAQTASFTPVRSRLLAVLPLLAAVSQAIWMACPTPVHGQSGPIAKLTGTGYESIVYADTLSAPHATATDGSGNIYYSDWITNTVYRESPGPNGFTQIPVASFGKDTPSAIAVDQFNDVFVVVLTDLPNGGSLNGVLYEESYVEYCGGTGCTPGWTQSVIPTTGLLAPMGLAVAIDNRTLNANISSSPIRATTAWFNFLASFPSKATFKAHCPLAASAHRKGLP